MAEELRKTPRAEDLNKALGPEFVYSRVGPGRQNLLYLKGHDAIALMNHFWGTLGWSSEEIWHEFLRVKESQGRFSTGCTVKVRVTVYPKGESGTFREGVGNGEAIGLSSELQAMEKAQKEAFTDAMKRAIVQFGEALGNCLYDKGYLEFMKGKVEGAERHVYTDEELLHIQDGVKVPGRMDVREVSDYFGGKGKATVVVPQGRKRVRSGRTAEDESDKRRKVAVEEQDDDHDAELLMDLVHDERRIVGNGSDSGASTPDHSYDPDIVEPLVHLFESLSIEETPIRREGLSEIQSLPSRLYDVDFHRFAPVDEIWYREWELQSINANRPDLMEAPNVVFEPCAALRQSRSEHENTRAELSEARRHANQLRGQLELANVRLLDAMERRRPRF